jgi:CheY-like chemotaxis protein
VGAGGKTAGRGAEAEGPGTLDLLLHEVRALREAQNLILEQLEDLRRAPAALEAPSVGDRAGFGDEGGSALSPIRARRPKAVVLVDDDPLTREAAVAELQQADVPVRAFGDGNAALSAIAKEKPDVIVLGLGGERGGRDLVNTIQARMEGVDIPIVLWTREDVSSREEIRPTRGADDVVQKSRGAAALLARIITVFRR